MSIDVKIQEMKSLHRIIIRIATPQPKPPLLFIHDLGHIERLLNCNNNKCKHVMRFPINNVYRDIYAPMRCPKCNLCLQA